MHIVSYERLCYTALKTTELDLQGEETVSLRLLRFFTERVIINLRGSLLQEYIDVLYR